MTDNNKLIRNSTAEFLIFTAQAAGEQSIAARYVDDIIWQKPTPSKGVQA